MEKESESFFTNTDIRRAKEVALHLIAITLLPFIFVCFGFVLSILQSQDLLDKYLDQGWKMFYFIGFMIITGFYTGALIFRRIIRK